MNSLSKKITMISIIKFTAPTVIMMIFLSLYTMVDGVFVSNMVGSNALSAVNIVYPAMSLVVAVSIMLATGASAIIGKEMGEGKYIEARQHFSFIIVVGIIIGIAFLIIGTVFVEPIIKLMGSTPLIHQYCKDYLFIIALGSPLAVLQMMFQFFFVTSGKPKIGLICTGLGGIINIVFDYLLIGPANLGVKGAGIATVMGYCVPAICGIVYFTFFRKNNLFFVLPKIDMKMLGKSCFNGSSEMITNLALSVTVFLFNMVMLQYLGEDGVAAITIVLYSQFLLTSAFLGFSSGVAPIFSFHYGAKNRDEIKKLFNISIRFVIMASLVIFGLSMLLAAPITAVFVRTGTSIFDIAKRGFLLFSVSYLFSGMNIFASSMFTAFSNGLVSAFISFLRTFLFLVAAILILPMFIGEPGIWLAVPLAEMLAITVAIFCIFKFKKRYGY